jgi:hypothetical protein
MGGCMVVTYLLHIKNTIIGTKNPLDEILLIENFNNNNYSSGTLYCKPSDIYNPL